MNKYRIDWRKLSMLLCPVCLRGEVLQGLLRALTIPVADAHSRLLQLREDAEYRITHNGQVCSLTGLLNDKFGGAQRGIRITEPPEHNDEMRLYQRHLYKQLMLPPRNSGNSIKLMRRGYAGTDAYGFWIVVPPECTCTEAEVRALTDRYRLAGVRYGVTLANSI